MARSASGLILINHCVESRGSTTVLQRSHLPSGNRVILLAHQKALLAQIFQHALARFITAQARIRAGVLVHVRVLVHDVDLRQVVPQAGLEIVGIVRRRHLHRAGAELGIRQLVGDDRNLPVHQRQPHFLAREDACSARPLGLTATAVSPSIVSGRVVATVMNSSVPDHRISDLQQLALDVSSCSTSRSRDRSHAPRTPVDDVLAAIDQPLFIQADENLAHGAESSSSMVKYSRSQSTDAPSRFIWSRMAPP